MMNFCEYHCHRALVLKFGHGTKIRAYVQNICTILFVANICPRTADQTKESLLSHENRNLQ
jgi:hypothetical protein